MIANISALPTHRQDCKCPLTIWIRMRWALHDRIRSNADSSEAKNALGSKQPDSPLTAALLTTPPLLVSLRRPLLSHHAYTTTTLLFKKEKKITQRARKRTDDCNT